MNLGCNIVLFAEKPTILGKSVESACKHEKDDYFVNRWWLKDVSRQE
jgi:hypothetical protein